MLDKDSPDQTGSSTTDPTTPAQATGNSADPGVSDSSTGTPPRRRRRAASRPAGPPVAAETDEPGEVRTSATTDPIFDAPAQASARTSEPRGQRPLVSDPFAVPSIDVSALRPQQADGGDDTDGHQPAPQDDGADAPEARSGGRGRSGSRATSRRAAKDTGTKDTGTKDTGTKDTGVAGRSADSNDGGTDATAGESTATGPADQQDGSDESGSQGTGERRAGTRRTRTSRSRAVKDSPGKDSQDKDSQDKDGLTSGDTAQVAADGEQDARDDKAGADRSGADQTGDEAGADTPKRAAVDDRRARDAGTPAGAATTADTATGTGHTDAGTTGADDDHDGGDDHDDQAHDDQAHDDHDDQDGTTGEGSSRRRRRRRGGRRRRRSGGDGDDHTDADDTTADSSGDSAAGGAAEGSSDDATDDADDADDGASSSRRRRRRRRRRTGEDADETARRRANDAVTGIDGSTRLEAKRQRRREGREAGRRRAPILSEAEFLARRESVRRAMVIRQRESLAQIAVLEDDMLVEHYVDHSTTRSLIGNVYLGKVQNVLPSMEAAFIDIGQGRNAVLYAGEVDWDAFDGGGNSKERKIESVLKSGQSVLVQVTKDPIGAKGARLTHHVSLPGRYIVYSPGGHLSGISRKLPDTERRRLKKVLSEHVDESASVIVRTAAEGASEDELVRDVTRLTAQWEAIEKKVKSGGAPQLLHAEPDPTVRIVRDLFTEDFAELVIAGNGGSDDAHDTIKTYVDHVAPHLADRVKRWDGGDTDVFTAHRIDEQIAKALERKVHLPSGGSLVIDRTEAMTVIDVNTGKFTGSGGNLEATVTSNNLEAAEEIVRQLRLRDIGGIIVIDFIDMVLPSNRELLLRRLVECLGRDRTRHQVAEVTSLGLVQMTRKRIGTGLGEAFTTPCEHCQGKGHVTHDEPVETKPDNSNGSGNGRNRSRSRGGSRNQKTKVESPKTPARQPLPKVMPPPPPGLAKVTGTDDHKADNDRADNDRADRHKADGASTGDGAGTEQTDNGRTNASEPGPAPDTSVPDNAGPAKSGQDKAGAADRSSQDGSGRTPTRGAEGGNDTRAETGNDTRAETGNDTAPDAPVDPVAAAMDALVAGTRGSD